MWSSGMKVFHPDGDEAGDAGDYEHPFDSVQQPREQGEEHPHDAEDDNDLHDPGLSYVVIARGRLK